MDLLDQVDEVFGLIIALDRQVVQGNWKQAYSIIKKLEAKLGVVSNDIYLHLITKSQLESEGEQ